ncbi:MAG: gamma-glutamyltransferase [Myxococcales bacterium]|nr:gamma-glutamyltransferase [Myxococcales bacterium]
MLRRIRGTVAAGHPDTANAGAEMFELGGNAVDAAVAAAFASAVVESLLTDLGGGGFMLVDDGKKGRLYDFFVRVPGLGRPSHPPALPSSFPRDSLDFRPIEIDFRGGKQTFHIGLGAAAVPGLIHGLCTVQKAEGKLPLREVVAPAVRLARSGTKLTGPMAFILQVIAPIFLQRPELAALVAPNGELLKEGDLFRWSPQLADLLETIGREGHRFVYEGEVARTIVETCRTGGGLITMEDLRTYETLIRHPLEQFNHNARFRLNGPSSTGGALIAFGLMLADGYCGKHPANSPENARVVAAVMETVAQARAEVMDTRSHTGYDRHYLGDATVTAHYRNQLALRLNKGAFSGPGPLAGRGSTTHISVIDEQGQAASITSSNGEGSSYLIEGTGIHLNNMLGEEDLNPLGFHKVAPGKRLPSMMCPMVIDQQDGTRTVLGSGGANRLRTALLQVSLHITANGLSLEDAILAPRLHLEGMCLHAEPDFSETVMDTLENFGYEIRKWPNKNLYFGGAHAVQRHRNGRLTGYGDPRRGGSVAGQID